MWGQRYGMLVQVKGDVAVLHRISCKLHARRFQGGALRLDNVKLSFGLDANGNPVTVEIYGTSTAVHDPSIVHHSTSSSSRFGFHRHVTLSVFHAHGNWKYLPHPH